MKTVAIMGLGYIGLPTALIATEYGYNVIGYDIDQQRVERINNYDPVIQEPELFDKLGFALTTNRFKATTTLEHADYFIIAVPTPFKEEKKADLSYVWQAATSLVSVLKKGNVVILESTVPVTTTQQLALFLESKTGLIVGIDLFVAHCPERVLPGKIFTELVQNPRIIGGITPQCVQQAKQFYKNFVVGPLYLTNDTTAEMVKLVENSSRDTQIAFANQVATMAYAIGLDPYEVIELANKHPRVDILNPSCGVGGHCIAVDPWFLIETFPEQTHLIKAARLVNDQKPLTVVTIVRNAVQTWQQDHTGKPTVFVMGLTYKPDIDDIRESPALAIALTLNTYDDMHMIACEPNISIQIIKQYLNAEQVVDLQTGINKADIIVCLVKHRHFKHADFSLVETKKVLDFCGLLYKSRTHDDTQEKMFWPASDFPMTSMREYSKEQLS